MHIPSRHARIKVATATPSPSTCAVAVAAGQSQTGKTTAAAAAAARNPWRASELTLCSASQTAGPHHAAAHSSTPSSTLLTFGQHQWMRHWPAGVRHMPPTAPCCAAQLLQHAGTLLLQDCCCCWRCLQHLRHCCCGAALPLHTSSSIHSREGTVQGMLHKRV